MKTKAVLSTEEKAQRAVSVFRSMQPTLNAYARNLTGRPDIRIMIAAHDNGSTDGKVIYYRPPIELGDETPHVRRDCNRRNEALQLLCPACALRETILRTIYHEVAHVWFDSFSGVSDYNKKVALQQIVKERGTDFAKEVEAKLDYRGSLSYMHLSREINEFFPFLINCLEDARVNRELFKALPGTEIMFKASTNLIFEHGVQQMVDGKWEKKEWKTYPLNAQITLGVFCIASGYDYTGWFAPVVEKALHDAELNRLVTQATTAYSAGDIFKSAFPILEQMRQLGFCKNEYEPEQEPEQEEKESTNEPEQPAEEEVPSDGPEGNDSDEAPGSAGSGDDSDDDESPAADAAGSPGDDETPGGTSGDGTPDIDLEGMGGGGSSQEDVPDPDGTGDGEAGTEGGDDGQHDDEELESVPGDHAPGRQGDSDEPRLGTGDPDGGLPDGGTEDASGDPPDGDSVEYEPIENSFTHGTKLVGEIDESEEKENDGSDLPMGTPEEVNFAFTKLSDHEEVPYELQGEIDYGREAVDAVIVLGMYFETPPQFVHGVRIYKDGDQQADGWNYLSSSYNKQLLKSYGVEGDFSPEESVVAPALLKARVAFADNLRGRVEINARKGKIRPSALGRRAPVNDNRMFQRKTLPGRKSYFVVIGIDISGSTLGMNIVLAKKLAMVEAEMLNRLGIPFEIWAHSAGRNPHLELHMYEIKTADEVWNDSAKKRLTSIGPDAYNLDGHALEFLRKRADASTATHKIIHYLSDGAMPAENYDEELAVLQREIKTCKKKGYTLTGIGIRTNSPEEHGLETVEVHQTSDIQLVISNLQRKLA